MKTGDDLRTPIGEWARDVNKTRQKYMQNQKIAHHPLGLAFQRTLEDCVWSLVCSPRGLVRREKAIAALVLARYSLTVLIRKLERYSNED